METRKCYWNWSLKKQHTLCDWYNVHDRKKWQKSFNVTRNSLFWIITCQNLIHFDLLWPWFLLVFFLQQVICLEPPKVDKGLWSLTSLAGLANPHTQEPQLNLFSSSPWKACSWLTKSRDFTSGLNEHTRFR